MTVSTILAPHLRVTTQGYHMSSSGGSLGCTSQVMDTLVKTWKVSINAIYHYICNRYLGFANRKRFDPFSSIKVHVLALLAISILRSALDPLLFQFIKAVLKIRPPSGKLFPQGDLSTVLALNVLASQPYILIEEVILRVLTLKTFY